MIRCIAFDFDTREEQEILFCQLGSAIGAGRFVWIDADSTPELAAASVEHELAPGMALSAEARALLARTTRDTNYAQLPDAIHFSVASLHFVNGPAGERLVAHRVDALLTDRYFLTLAKGPAEFIVNMRRDFRDDFHRFAQTPGFLLYEFWDHLARCCEHLEHRLEGQVDAIQSRLAGQPDAAIFPLAARVAANVVRLRRHVAPARAVLHEFATRRFPQIPERTQPFLLSTAAELDRVLTDLTVSREILTDAVTLSMSYVGFRTNRIINRLTTMSFIFLPLTFLVGVYGMNFENQPEYKWAFGYAFFWTLASFIAGVSGLTLWVLWRLETARLDARHAALDASPEPRDRRSNRRPPAAPPDHEEED